MRGLGFIALGTVPGSRTRRGCKRVYGDRQSITPVTVRVAQRLTAEQLEKLKEKMRRKRDGEAIKLRSSKF